MVYERIAPRTFTRTFDPPSDKAHKFSHPKWKVGDDLVEVSELFYTILEHHSNMQTGTTRLVLDAERRQSKVPTMCDKDIRRGRL
jgi:hypothetical protein